MLVSFKKYYILFLCIKQYEILEMEQNPKVGINTSATVPKCFQQASGDLQECLLTRRSVAEATLLWFLFMQDETALISTYLQVPLQEKCAHARSRITRFTGRRTSSFFSLFQQINTPLSQHLYFVLLGSTPIPLAKGK